jgi:hypothetical protein
VDQSEQGGLPASWEIRGSPVGYSSGAPEQCWKAEIKAAVPEAPAAHPGSGMFADFHVPAPSAHAPGFDLDNLLDPVLSAVVNGRGWFGRRRPNLRWLAARKQVASPPGLSLAVRDTPPRLWRRSEVTTGLDSVYRGDLPGARTVREYAVWVEYHRVNRLPRGQIGVSLDIADERVNLGDVATGKIKILIDGLWPVLGGHRGAPDDGRIAALIVRKGIVDLDGTVMIKVVGLPGADSPTHRTPLGSWLKMRATAAPSSAANTVYLRSEVDEAVNGRPEDLALVVRSGNQ